MKYAKLFLMIMAVAAIVSCSKDDSSSGPAQGTMTTSIDGTNTSFTVLAYRQQGNNGTTNYDFVYVIGFSGAGTSSYKSFAVYVYGTNITTKTYNVPTYNSNYDYDYTTGFAAGIYLKGITQTTYDTYASLNTQNASGTVTLTSLTTSAVAGSYDMTLTNTADLTKTMKFSGSFNAKIYGSVK